MIKNLKITLNNILKLLAMLQKSQIGQYRRKEIVMNAKKGKTFVTPNNRQYQFDYRKEGNKYIIIIGYNGYKMQIDEVSYNTINTDMLLESMEIEPE